MIVFEGIDGVGKSSLVRALLHHLQKQGIPAMCYEDTEDPRFGFNLLKPFIKKEADINTSLFFYVSSSLYKARCLKEFLHNKWVICDRYIYSTLAAHTIRGAQANLYPKLKDLPIRIPDFLFLITAKENIRMKRARMRKNAKPDDLKPKKRGSLVWKMEHELKKFQPIIIDNSSSLEITLKKIIRCLEKN